MAADDGLVHSVLDRLVAEDGAAAGRPGASASQSLRELTASVRRDLQLLLNTRLCAQPYPPKLGALEHSLVNYGVPDFTTADFGSDRGRSELAREFEQAIRRHETRFKSVRVTLLENAESLDRTLRLRIDAVMYAEPTPEQVVFDTTCEPARGNVLVQASANV